jgi:hypothetical protein
MKRLLVGLVLLAAARGTLSAQVSLTLPDFGTLRAGGTARIEWRGLPADVEEMELLLSVEGRELPIRVTAQLAARTGVLLWRVPNVPARRARLTIRFGSEGEEYLAEPSAPFAILPSENERPAALLFRDGEWWEKESAVDPLRGSLAGAAGGDRLQDERESLPGAAPPPPHVTDPRPAARAPGSAARSAAPGRRGFLLSRRPAEIPARI